MQGKQYQEIIKLPANIHGHDLMTGDIHGHEDCLEKIITQHLKPHDRLFISGDLIDRGTKSLEVILQLMKHRDRVYCVLGNHEVNFLDLLKLLEILVTNIHHVNFAIEKPKNWFDIFPELNDPHLKESKAIFTKQIKNGGSWLLQLFWQEYKHQTIFVVKEKMCYSPTSNIKKIKEYIETLPYIIHVEGPKGFHVVHADMPFDDKTLFAKMNNYTGLSDWEKYYAVNARKSCSNDPDSVFKDVGRTKTAVVVFTGHNNMLIFDQEPFRKTNTYNLDIGTFKTNVSLVVNITTGKCFFIGNTTLLKEKFYANIQKITQFNLYFLHNVQSFLQAIEDCVSAIEIKTVLDKWSTIPLTGDMDTCFFDRQELIECGKNHAVLKTGMLKRMDYVSSRHSSFFTQKEFDDADVAKPLSLRIA